jgi:type IV pilus assembly protein PilM
LPAAGFDFSDGSVKYVLLGLGKRGIELQSYGSANLPEGSIVRGRIEKPDDIAAILRKIQHDTGIENAHAALPEEQAYLFDAELPSDTRDRASVIQSLEFNLKENVPLAPEEAYFDFELLEVESASPQVSVSVYPRAGVEAYASVFADARLKLLSLEIEGQATARACVPRGLCETALIVDLGKQGSGISIVSRGVLVFTASVELCGDHLTKAVADRLNLSIDDAESWKLSRGFVRTKENEEAFAAMLPVIVALRDEINRHCMYWKMHSMRERSSLAQVQCVILCGGTANLSGIVEYLNATLDVPVSLANVWQNSLSLERHIPEISHHESLRYATAIGLAMRGLARSFLHQRQV